MEDHGTAYYSTKRAHFPFICVKGNEGCCLGESNCYCPLSFCDVPPGLAMPPPEHTEKFQVPIKQNLDNEHFFCWCCYTFWCLPCATYVVRWKALDGNLDNYSCCQGYFQNCCCGMTPGSCGERTCPICCMCLEACLCPECSMSATRMFLMNKYGLASDPSDHRIIRTNNTFATAYLATSIVLGGTVIPNITGLAAMATFWCTIGGMNFQMINEIQNQTGNGNIGSGAPTYEAMYGRIV